MLLRHQNPFWPIRYINHIFGHLTCRILLLFRNDPVAEYYTSERKERGKICNLFHRISVNFFIKIQFGLLDISKLYIRSPFCRIRLLFETVVYVNILCPQATAASEKTYTLLFMLFRHQNPLWPIRYLNHIFGHLACRILLLFRNERMSVIYNQV